MRIAFLGNHTVGVRTLDAIAEAAEVAAVVAHPEDPEDGVRYESVHDHAVARGWPVLRAAGRDPELPGFLRAARPEVLVIADYRYLLPREVLELAPLAINLHPSLLPRYRGRAPLNWAILEGERTLGLTAHVVDEGMDTGDVVASASFELGEDEDVGDALERLYPLYARLTREVLAELAAGELVRVPQDETLATAFPARRPEDGLIDWTQPARRVRDLVRAVAPPYPGAFTFAAGERIAVRRARLARNAMVAPVGSVVALAEDGPVVRCGEGAVVLVDADGPLERGTVLG